MTLTYENGKIYEGGQRSDRYTSTSEYIYENGSARLTFSNESLLSDKGSQVAVIESDGRITSPRTMQELGRIDDTERAYPGAPGGAQLGLTDDEVAFYDALATNESALRELTDATLKQISRELVEAIRANVTIDWTIKEQVRAKMRVIIKRLPKKYRYPPDLQPAAVALVLQQAEANCADWAA